MVLENYETFFIVYSAKLCDFPKIELDFRDFYCLTFQGKILKSSSRSVYLSKINY